MTNKQNKRSRAYLAAALVGVVLGSVAGVYLSFFTPEKRIVRAHLREADEKCEAAITARLKPVYEVLEKGRKGARPFAEDAMSLPGKLNALAGLFDGQSHKEYVAEAFARHVFRPNEFRDAVEGAVRGYLIDVEGIEAEMLVKLRADLATHGVALPQLVSDEAFAQEYQRLVASVAAELRVDLGMDVARLVAGEVVAQVVTQALAAAAAEMGISLTVMGSATAATLGIGALVGILADYLIGLVLDALGYDAAAEIEKQVRDSLNKVQDSLLRHDALFSSEGAGALRARLEQLHEARSQVRRAAVKLYLKGGDK